jgi:hypothetical protein
VRRMCLGLIMLLAMSSVVQAVVVADDVNVIIRQKVGGADYLELDAMLSTNTIADIKNAIFKANGTAASRITLWGTADGGNTWTKLLDALTLDDVSLIPYYLDGPTDLYVYITVAPLTVASDTNTVTSPPPAPPVTSDTYTGPYADVLQSRINTFLQSH